MTTAIEFRKIIARNKAREEGKIQAVPKAIQAVGGITPQTLTGPEILVILSKVHGVSGNGVEDGTRVHIHYKAFGVSTPHGIKCAARAAELGLERDRYTGRVHRVWTSRNGDQCITLWVELERDHMYRTLNLVKGDVMKFVILGD